jgi:hypothetical protein
MVAAAAAMVPMVERLDDDMGGEGFDALDDLHEPFAAAEHEPADFDGQFFQSHARFLSMTLHGIL